MPTANPTHLTLLYYKGEEGMFWHKDDDENDGDDDNPVVLISLGNTCDFGLKVDGVEVFAKFESGDVILFGGPQRLVEHCVGRLYPETCPDFLVPVIGDARVSFIFVSAPKIIGRESEFRYMVEMEHLRREEVVRAIKNKNKDNLITSYDNGHIYDKK